MEKSDIIKKFLSEGFQLDGSALEFLLNNKDKIEEILKRLKEKEQKFFISSEDIKKVLLEKTLKFEIVDRDFSKRDTISVDSLVEFFTNRYTNFLQFFLKRMELVNLISINKITPKTNKFSIVAMIRKLEGKRILAEDLTGQLELELSHDNIFLTEDEVLGIVCKREGEKYYVENIYYPDIPLRKEATHTNEEINCFFISDLDLNAENFRIAEKLFDETKDEKNLFFILGSISNEISIYKKFLSFFPKERTIILNKEEKFKDYLEGYNFSFDPTFVRIENVNLILSYGKIFEPYVKLWGISPENAILNLIKKRHLNPTFKYAKEFFVKDPLFLDIVPDIICVGYFRNASQINYKSTTILINGGPPNTSIWKVNLKTRESIKIDLK